MKNVKKILIVNQINRKNSCFDDNKKEFMCNKCERNFSRKDSLKRHMKKCDGNKKQNKNIPIVTNNGNYGNYGNYGNNGNYGNYGNYGNVNNGNNNIINNNGTYIAVNNFLFPFGKDGTNCLSTPEKIAIFSSNENPMEMIIIKINLDPRKRNHHNVGYPDKQSGYGIIFDGDNWITERIDVIMNVLLESKEKDLLNIYDEIKQFLSDDKNNMIKDKLDDLNKKLNPRTVIDVKSKKNLVVHLKKHLYNNRKLALDAKKNIELLNKDINHKNIFENILKDGITIEDVDKGIKLQKLKKELALDLLDSLNCTKREYKLISSMINKIKQYDG